MVANANTPRLNRGWVQTIITLATLLVVGAAAWTTIGKDVEQNKLNDAEQDTCIKQNVADIRRIELGWTRIDERLEQMQGTQNDIKTLLLERSDGH